MERMVHESGERAQYVADLQATTFIVSSQAQVVGAISQFISVLVKRSQSLED